MYQDSTMSAGGYRNDFSMSNRAATAYDNGLMPASKVTAADLRNHGIQLTVKEWKVLAARRIPATEWHHTSAKFNQTEFFDLAGVAERYADPAQLVADKDFVRQQIAANGVELHRNCRVEWLEWQRGVRRPTEREAEGATVAVKGSTATITFTDGATMVKRLDTNGFRFESAAQRKVRERRERENEKHAREMIRNRARLWADVTRRFRAAAKGKRFESCDYFQWRDDFNRDSSAVTWTPITHAQIIDALRESGLDYANRTIDRLEAGDREVVRVGLHTGIREIVR